MILANILLLVNLSGQPWNSGDFNTLKSANITCTKKYKTKVSKFIKKPENHYNVMCGDNNVELKEEDLYTGNI